MSTPEMKLMPLLPGWAVPRSWAGEWRQEPTACRHTRSPSLREKTLLVALYFFASGFPGFCSHESETSRTHVQREEARWVAAEDVGPFLSGKLRTTTGVVTPTGVPVADLFTVSPLETLDAPRAEMVSKTVEAGGATATPGSPLGTPPQLRRGASDSQGNDMPPEKPFDLSPFLKRGPDGVAVGRVSEDMRQEGDPTDIKTPETPVSSEGSPSTDTFPAADPFGTASKPGAGAEKVSNPGPVAAAEADKKSEERHLRPQPYPVGVPVPVPYFAGVYPGVPPVSVAPVPAYPGRVAVPPPFPLSPLVAGPTVTAPPPVVGPISPAAAVAAPVMYGPPTVAPAIMPAVPAAAAPPVQQVTVTVTPAAPAPAPFLAWVVPAAR